MFHPISCSAQVAKPKIPNSISKRIKPGVIIGAKPDLLGSFGTAKTPQIMAKRIGKPIAKMNRNQLSFCCQPQIPKEISAITSNINLNFFYLGSSLSGFLEFFSSRLVRLLQTEIVMPNFQKYFQASFLINY